jgi:hypothetical protein
MDQISFQNTNDNLIRLRRHFDINTKGYDRPALLDLVHVLRVWADMKVEVANFLLQGAKNPVLFYNYALQAKLKMFLRGKECIVFPDGVTARGISTRTFFFVNHLTDGNPMDQAHGRKIRLMIG